jgi:hypothetical protein
VWSAPLSAAELLTLYTGFDQANSKALRFRLLGARWTPHRPREDGLTHPADTSRSNLAAALALLSRWRLQTSSTFE